MAQRRASHRPPLPQSLVPSPSSGAFIVFIGCGVFLCGRVQINAFRPTHRAVRERALYAASTCGLVQRSSFLVGHVVARHTYTHSTCLACRSENGQTRPRTRHQHLLPHATLLAHLFSCSFSSLSRTRC